MQYDLEGRTRKFAAEVISLVRDIQITQVNKNIISQLLRSATSIGANYAEANGGSSKKDFQNKISIARKECKETEYWVELLAGIESKHIDRLRKLWKEAHELMLIFGKITSTLRKSK